MHFLQTILKLLFLSTTVCTGADSQQFGQMQFFMRGPADFQWNRMVNNHGQSMFMPFQQFGLRAFPSQAIGKNASFIPMQQFGPPILRSQQNASSNNVQQTGFIAVPIQHPPNIVGLEPIDNVGKVTEEALTVAEPPPEPECCQNEPDTGVFYSVAEKHGAAVTGSVAGKGHVFSQERRDWCPDFGKSKYRTFDGTCNHPRNLGSSFTPVSRLLPPVYDDGLNSPRTKGEDGSPLPSPRVVSSSIHPSESNGEDFTHMLMQWGQWVDHDMTAIITASNRSNPTRCCGPDGALPGVNTNKDCFPIELPETEKNFRGRCMEFVRSLAATNATGQPLQPREQVNSLNAFIDGSQIYGATSERAALLREKDDYMLRTKGDFPPESPDGGCILRPGSKDYCFITGDLRTHENPALTALHVIWMREHNRMARELHALKPQADKEEIYQIIRKIVGALQQIFTLNHYLPIVLGKDAYRLRLVSKEGRTVYNRDTDPRIFNAFTAAAFRFGHSSIPSAYAVGDKLVPMREMFNRPALVLDDMDSLLRGLVGMTKYKEKASQKVDRNFVEEITQHLFEPNSTLPGRGLDLVSLNIQRARDHGLPPYTKWRTFCGLRPVYGFNDTEALGPYSSQLGKVYRSVNDIDLFTAIVHEPIDTGLLGPTGRCLVGIQFARAKFGDRFIFDTDDYRIAFTEEQLAAMRKMTLSHVICQNTKIDSLPVDVFRFSDPTNPVVTCAALRAESLDLSLFN